MCRPPIRIQFSTAGLSKFQHGGNSRTSKAFSLLHVLGLLFRLLGGRGTRFNPHHLDSHSSHGILGYTRALSCKEGDQFRSDLYHRMPALIEVYNSCVLAGSVVHQYPNFISKL
jgi:hypothetical protein